MALEPASYTYFIMAGAPLAAVALLLAAAMWRRWSYVGSAVATAACGTMVVLSVHAFTESQSLAWGIGYAVAAAIAVVVAFAFVLR